MTTSAERYARYFPLAPEHERWGLAVTGAGFARIKPGAPYPAPGHPADHALDQKRGRVLEAFQIVLIAKGGGWFETATGGEQRLAAGDAFAVLPKVWHRYRPDPETGWEESWVELQGPVMDKLRRAKVLSAGAALRRGALAAGLEEALHAVHALARTARPIFDPELSALALRVVATWQKATAARAEAPRLSRAVGEAERFLADHLGEPVNVEDLAKKLGVSYPHFRRAFKAHTGFAPWRYVLHLRLSHARRLLVTTDRSLEEIGGGLGFSSAFHLSAAFKQAFGMAPDHWRRKFATARRATL